ncbi:MAG TPA: hypothetical protein VN969_20740 [Streptosporangiaceae bacterium]|nr:hypothetical protein [Streptosporangiaceae bacterium]
MRPSGVGEAGTGRSSTSSGCACTSRPPSAAAAAMSGAACSIHSNDSGMISSRWRALTFRIAAAVTGTSAARRGRA